MDWPSPIAQSVALLTWEQVVIDLIPGSAKYFLRTDDSHCDRIHSSLKAVCCFDNGYVGKQLVAWKENCAEYGLKELQESMDRCTGCHDITEILLKTALNTIQSINQSKKRYYTGLALSALPFILPSVTNIFRRTFLSNHASQPLQTWYDASSRGPTGCLLNSEPPVIYFLLYDLVYFPT